MSDSPDQSSCACHADESRTAGESATLDLRAGVKAQGALLDRFGIVSGGTGGGEVKFSLDDLKYSAGKP